MLLCRLQPKPKLAKKYKNTKTQNQFCWRRPFLLRPEGESFKTPDFVFSPVCFPQLWWANKTNRKLTILPPHANTNILNVFRLDHCFKFNPPPLQSQMSQHSLPHSMSPIGSGIGYGMSGLPCSMQTSPTSINQSMIMVSCSHLFTSFPSLLSLLPLLLDFDWWLRAWAQGSIQPVPSTMGGFSTALR